MKKINEVINFFNITKDRKVPYKNSDLVEAVKGSSSDIPKLEEMMNAMALGYVRMNPEKPKHEMIKNAYDTMATLAYLSDHNPTRSEFQAIGLARAYSESSMRGPAMESVLTILNGRGIDLSKDVLAKRVGLLGRYRLIRSLNKA